MHKIQLKYTISFSIIEPELEFSKMNSFFEAKITDRDSRQLSV